jgi:hypothetical protein
VAHGVSSFFAPQALITSPREIEKLIPEFATVIARIENAVATIALKKAGAGGAFAAFRRVECCLRSCSVGIDCKAILHLPIVG